MGKFALGDRDELIAPKSTDDAIARYRFAFGRGDFSHVIGNLGVDVGLDFLVYLYIDDFFFRAGFFYFRAGFFVFCLGFFAFRFGFFAFRFGFFVFRDDFVVCRVVVWIL